MYGSASEGACVTNLTVHRNRLEAEDLASEQVSWELTGAEHDCMPNESSPSRRRL